VKISYLVTCHNEYAELLALLNGQLRPYLERNKGDELVILWDKPKEHNPDMTSLLYNAYDANVVMHDLNGDFGTHKTYGSRQCKGDYICQLDADEHFSPVLLENMHELLESNPQVELYRVPRVNIVRGATQEDARKWGWKMYSLPEFPGLPIINWEFDYQARIYKNTEKIKWHKPLHETITGAEYVSVLPLEVDYAIIHDKTIDRQRAQNEFYNKNWSAKANMGQG